MKLINLSKGKVISSEITLASSFFGRLKGLMFTFRARDLILVSHFPSISSATIHMLFMFYPLDVIWLDENKRVVDIQKNIPPFNPMKPKTWRIYSPKKPAKYVVELGRGKSNGVEIGDLLAFR